MIKDVGIIGAGPSGLALGMFLQKSFDILEKNFNVGGHAASFVDSAFTFDYGPHILFSRDKDILDFIIKSLNDNVMRCRRNNKISYKDRLLKYPFENDLKSLPLEDNFQCIHSFLINPYKKIYEFPSNMYEWFLKTFGEGICTKYLFPYNEKVWNIPVERLSMNLIDRIPVPPVEDILKSSLGYQTEGYLHQLYYHYPKRGGYQAISEAWRQNMPIIFDFDVALITIDDKNIFKITNKKGDIKKYKNIVSTMLVHELIQKIEFSVPEEVSNAVNHLIVNPMIIVSFGVQGIDSNQFTAIYFPEKEFWVNRISYPCTFSAENGPDKCWSLQAEITCLPESDIWKKSDEEILQHVKNGLQQRKLLPSDYFIIVKRVDRKSHSYVVYDTEYEKNIKLIRNWFKSINIHLLGRFGYFEYINIDGAIERALQVAMKINQDEGEYIKLKRSYLKTALHKTCKDAYCG